MLSQVNINRPILNNKLIIISAINKNIIYYETVIIDKHKGIRQDYDKIVFETVTLIVTLVIYVTSVTIRVAV